jgi:hypothetical protein
MKLNKTFLLAAGMLAVWLSALSGLWCETTWAETVPPSDAHKLVATWLAKDAKPFGSRLGSQVESVEMFIDAEGQPVYYVVYLRPNGFVIVPADDEVEPIICFVSAGSYDPSDRNPLGAMVSRDLPARVNAVRVVQKKARPGQATGILTEKETAVRKSAEKAFSKWTKLLSQADTSSALVKSTGSISDVRVAPLLQTKWGQTTVCGSACFNYYTPPYGEGDTANYYCGCTATAMAQYMRFWQYPTVGVGTDCFTIRVDGALQTRCLRGGDGSGGAYNWSLMTLVPGCSTTLAQRQAMGALTYDAGVAVGMDYKKDGSAAAGSDAADALVNTFDYSNAIFGFNNSNNIGAGLNDMANPNLDYGNPVILSIAGPDGGHAIVADGYGYDGSTLYHHLNMGWNGSDDAWYNLPDIDSSHSFNIVDGAIYNVYISGTGEIISGRVTVTDSGAPIADATVTAQKASGGTYQATTNTNGIYAIAKVPSNSTYTVSVDKSGYSFTSQVTSTGQSQDYEATSGNCWAIDFTGILAIPVPVASDSNATAESGSPETITLQAIDDGQPNPPGALTYIITSLPSHGTLADPCAGNGNIGTVPYSLVDYGKNVTYTSISGYTGPDSFQFKANDGGSPPTGGDSNVATVSITVQTPSPQVIYETNFDTGLPAGWTIVDGGSSSDTWRSDNPGDHISLYWTGVFVDSYYAGYVDMDEQLITQDIDCTRLADVKLRFKHTFYRWSDEIGDVDIRVNGGQWQKVARYRQANYYGGLVELALSNFGADGDPNVQIRWHYYNANHDGYWGIDDVQIIASPAVSTVVIKKCSVTAGSKDNSDTISISGLMDATTGDISAASSIEVTIDSNDMVNPCVQTFPIDEKSFKKGKYNYTRTENATKTSFKFDTKTGKFSFMAKNIDLSGLGCPLTVEIEIGDYIAETEVDEAVVNGPKKPIPIKFMMGVKNSLRVDRYKVNRGKKPNTDQLSVKGGFTVEDPDMSMANRVSEGLAVTFGTHQFTIPANELKAGEDKFTFKNAPVNEGGLANGGFYFKTCVFMITIKNITITTGFDAANFCVEFAGFSECVPIVLP